MISSIKRLFLLLLVFFLVFWSARIISLNRNEQVVVEYKIGEEIDCGDLILCPVESVMCLKREYNSMLLDNALYLDDSIDDYVIAVCIEVTNDSESDIYLDDIMNFIEVGFESELWCSSINPEYGIIQNVYPTNVLSPGDTQRVWLAADVSRICFKDKTWNEIDKVEFVYVLQISPSKIVVRLNT